MKNKIKLNEILNKLDLSQNQIEDDLKKMSDEGILDFNKNRKTNYINQNNAKLISPLNRESFRPVKRLENSQEQTQIPIINDDSYKEKKNQADNDIINDYDIDISKNTTPLKNVEPEIKYITPVKYSNSHLEAQLNHNEDDDLELHKKSYYNSFYNSFLKNRQKKSSPTHSNSILKENILDNDKSIDENKEYTVPVQRNIDKNKEGTIPIERTWEKKRDTILNTSISENKSEEKVAQTSDAIIDKYVSLLKDNLYEISEKKEDKILIGEIFEFIREHYLSNVKNSKEGLKNFKGCYESIGFNSKSVSLYRKYNKLYTILGSRYHDEINNLGQKAICLFTKKGLNNNFICSTFKGYINKDIKSLKEIERLMYTEDNSFMDPEDQLSSVLEKIKRRFRKEQFIGNRELLKDLYSTITKRYHK